MIEGHPLQILFELNIVIEVDFYRRTKIGTAAGGDVDTPEGARCWAFFARKYFWKSAAVKGTMWKEMEKVVTYTKAVQYTWTVVVLEYYCTVMCLVN
jgi:hypothetical protein